MSRVIGQASGLDPNVQIHPIDTSQASGYTCTHNQGIRIYMYIQSRHQDIHVHTKYTEILQKNIRIFTTQDKANSPSEA